MMKKRLKLKPFVLPMIYSVFVLILLVAVFITRSQFVVEKDDDETYVTGSILDSYVPVINLDVTITRPYTNEDVKIGKDFYSYEDDSNNQTNSIVLYENTYMQNSGIDYVSENTFDVVAILDGEVIEIKNEELLGTVVTIRHDNDIISVYQSLGELSVENGEKVTQGQIIGKSGTSVLNKELNNHLHFELVIQGALKDPENYFDKKLNEIEE